MTHTNSVLAGGASYFTIES